jgi:hypothetical protein
MRPVAISFQRENQLMELASNSLLCPAVTEFRDGVFEPYDCPHNRDASMLQARVLVSHGVPLAIRPVRKGRMGLLP